MNFPFRRALLLGSRGQLGQALVREAEARKLDFEFLTWEAMHEQVGSAADLNRFLRERLPGIHGRISHVVMANGLTDPKRDLAELVRANVDLPRYFREALGAEGIRYVTFGSIMERLPEVCATNSYLKSKLGLFEEIEGLGPSWDVMHVRIHTLYGAYPPPHMFLGQILLALRGASSFRMTSGRQMREYHHVDDIAASVWDLILRPETSVDPSCRTFDLTSGEPVRLAGLARHIFRAFGQEALLEVGALPDPAQENLETQFASTFPSILKRKRAVLPAVVEVLRAHVGHA